VEIHHGGLDLGMAQIALDNPQVHTFLQKVCGIRVTQGMDVHGALGDAGPAHSFLHGYLDGGFSHGRLACGSEPLSASESGKDQARVSVRLPVIAEHRKGLRRQGNHAILGPLAAVNMDEHTVTVDISDLQVQRLLEAQAAGVDGEEECLVVGGVHTGKDAGDLILGEDGGERFGALCSEIAKDIPIALQDILEEEAYAAVADTQRGGGPLSDVSAIEKIFLQFLLGNEVRGLAVELHQQAHLAGVGALRALHQSCGSAFIDLSYQSFIMFLLLSSMVATKAGIPD